jgi:hypothetical protein
MASWSLDALRDRRELVRAMPRQDEEWRDAEVRLWIWDWGGRIFKRRGEDRATARRVLGLLRRMWWAHCAGRNELAAVMARDARDVWVLASQEALAASAGRAELVRGRRQSAGRDAASRRWRSSEQDRIRRDQKILDAAETGASPTDLAERFGVTPRRVQQILAAKSAK